MSYTEIRAELAEQYGWSFDVIDNMSFEQIVDARCGGKPESDGVPFESVEQFHEIQQNRRKYLGI